MTIKGKRIIGTPLGTKSSKYLNPCLIKPNIVTPIKIVAAKTIEAGSIITRNDIAIKSPGDGLAPYNLNYIIGKNATKTFIKDEDIDLIHIK